MIAIEDDTPQAAAALEAAIAAAHDERIQLRRVASIYPAGGEKQLITAIFDVEVPAGGLPADVSTVCLNVGTAAAVAHWVRDGAAADEPHRDRHRRRRARTTQPRRSARHVRSQR